MTTLPGLCATYLNGLRAQRAQANTTGELSYREFLGAFLRDAAQALKAAAHFTHEGKQIAVGRPDYTVTQGQRVIGYVEAEALDTPLSQLKGHAKEQNTRFRQNLHNFLLTNHLQFQLFVDGALVASASLGDLAEPGGRPLPVSAGGDSPVRRQAVALSSPRPGDQDAPLDSPPCFC